MMSVFPLLFFTLGLVALLGVLPMGCVVISLTPMERLISTLGKWRTPIV